MQITRLLIAGCLALTPLAPSAQSRLLVSANANQFPQVTVRVRVYDAKTGDPVAGLSPDKFLVSEDLSAVAPGGFKTLSGTAGRITNVDVMFVFDQTGSMSDEIEALRQRTLKFADMIARAGINYRLGLVSFSDIVEKKYEYTPLAEQFKKNVSDLTAEGGGDDPENQLDALTAALAMPSRPDARRVVILVTDAPYHFQDGVTKRRPESVIEAFKAAGVQLHIVGPELDSYRNMSEQLAGTFYDKDSGDFTGIVKTLGGDISANYEFTYVSPRNLRDGTRRAIRVALKGDAATDASQYVAPWFVTASSRRDASRGDASAFAPQRVIDGDGGTAWYPSEVGAAEDEWLRMSLPAPRTIAKVTVAAASGTRFSEREFVTLSVDGGSDMRGVPSDDGHGITFDLPAPAPIRELRLSMHAGAGAHPGLAEVEARFPDGGLIPEIAVHHITATARESAEAINARGEKAYHAGRLDESIALYKEAISANPDYAQAHSNLGLSYWKMKRYPESVAANRTAIALGRQQGNAVVVASSYYNIAKTFEEQKEYKQALMNFWWAQQTSPKPVYEKAIARMNALLARDAE